MFSPKLILAGLALLSLQSPLSAALTLRSIDYTPQQGTTWADSTVRLNFGSLGMGTVTFTSVNTGYHTIVAANANYNAAPYSSYSGHTELGNGDIYDPLTEVVFAIENNFASGFAGFTMTISLDTGTFTPGSVFGIRSLGQNLAGNYQMMTLGAGLTPVDTIQLPTDDIWATIPGNPPTPDLIETSPGSGIYVTDGPGSNSYGRAFHITGNSFSVTLTGNYRGGGEAFTIATPIPEPSSSLLFCAAGGLIALKRRRRA